MANALVSLTVVPGTSIQWGLVDTQAGRMVAIWDNDAEGEIGIIVDYKTWVEIRQRTTYVLRSTGEYEGRRGPLMIDASRDAVLILWKGRKAQ